MPASDKPKILLVSHGFPPNSVGGTEAHVAALRGSLIDRYEVFVICRDARTNIPEEEDGILRLPPGPALGSVDELLQPCDPAFETALQSYVIRTDPHVAHVHHWCHLSNHLVRLLREHGVPVVVTLHDHYVVCPASHMLRGDGTVCSEPAPAEECALCLPPPHAAFEGESSWNRFLRASGRRLLNITSLPPAIRARAAAIHRARREEMRAELVAASRIISPSHALKDEIAKLWPSLAGRIDYRAHGVDISWSEDVRKTPSRSVRFAYVGTLSPHKGLIILLAAARLLHSEAADISLYGGCPDPHFLQWLTSLTRNLGIELKGPYGPEDLPAIYSDVDVAIMPSICRENAPLGVLEAFAGGAPVIVSDLGGLPEPVQEGRTGLLVAPGDAGDLAEKMRRFISEPTLLEAMRKNIRPPKSMEEYSKEIAAIYDTLIL